MPGRIDARLKELGITLPAASTPAAKRTRLLICIGLATVAMLAGTPWPGTRGGRPLFRF